ncbi:VOC family protein [Tranquillimonas alkanivorans]|uniref:PhnB protein n=1 Tax=Tranquillimonas alkanivorans TaxID=441119 RepID=A0A1I5KQH5_9RHOB|nr:VOC family protein [Tranquillimonas alkanivorans]SFO86946.1 PhnB protein [Tranquillimonas alkanivorans]
MQPIPYLFFKSTCAEAMRTYAGIFGGTPEIMTFDQMPDGGRSGMPDMPGDAVMHAALKMGDGWLYASDDPSCKSSAMSGCSVAVSFPTVDEARRVYDALAERGEVRMAFEPTFWSPGFGMLNDRFGISWMVMTDAPNEGAAA